MRNTIQNNQNCVLNSDADFATKKKIEVVKSDKTITLNKKSKTLNQIN